MMVNFSGALTTARNWASTNVSWAWNKTATKTQNAWESARPNFNTARDKVCAYKVEILAGLVVLVGLCFVVRGIYQRHFASKASGNGQGGNGVVGGDARALDQFPPAQSDSSRSDGASQQQPQQKPVAPDAG